MTRQTTTNRDHEPSNHPSRASVRIVLALGVLVHSLVGIVVGRRRQRSSDGARPRREGRPTGNGTEGNVATRRRTRGDDDDDDDAA